MAPLSIPVPHRENVSQNIEELGTEVLSPKKNEKSRLKWFFNFEISFFIFLSDRDEAVFSREKNWREKKLFWWIRFLKKGFRIVFRKITII